MDSFSISVQPVYSRLAERSADVVLPPGWKLAGHQQATLDAFNDPDVDVVFNTAMTGDGKTLAAFLPLLERGKRRQALASYPTNELIRDQVRAVGETLEQSGLPLPLARMYGAEISRLMEMDDTPSRAEKVKQLLHDNEVILTNPDLFHLLMSYNYGYRQGRELIMQMQMSFHYFIFDEFHIFGPPQVIAIMNIINAVAVERRNLAPEHRRKFVFLSATPDPLMQRMLANSGLRCRIIDGDYSATPAADRRRILAGCALMLEPLDEARRAEAWVRDHQDQLLDYYRAYPGSKGAIILNSVAAVRRLVAELRPIFEARGLKIGENTALTGDEERLRSFDADLVIGTSTIDIGVDFHINLLVFEAGSAAQFVQRFGRVGRHTGYQARGVAVTFSPDSYRAYALCPRFVCARLNEKLVDNTPDQVRADGGTLSVDRPWLSREVMPEIFPTRQEFASYARRWGIVQAAQHVVNLDDPKYGPANYKELRDALVEQYARSFGTSTGHIWRAVGQYREYAKQDGKDGRSPGGRILLRELNSFRGQSLGCGVWDETDGDLKTYSLLYIFANAEFDLLAEATFMDEVRRRGKAEHEYRHQLFYVCVQSYLPERDDFSFTNPLFKFRTTHRDMLNHAVVLPGFQVANLRRQQIGKVNKRLEMERLVCTITPEATDPAQLKRLLKLEPAFPLHRLTDNGGSAYCVAFGKEALLLDSLLWWRKNAGDPEAYFDSMLPAEEYPQ